MINYIFEIDVCGERTKYSDVCLTSGDINAARFTFVFRKGKEAFDTEGLSLIIKAKRADGIIITDAGRCDGEKLYADIKNSMTEIEGELSFEIALTDASGSIATVSEIITYVREGYGESNLGAYDTTPVLATLSSRALSAEQSATEAQQSATEAQQSAKEAQQSANEAEQSANEAEQSANEAEQSANEAQQSATEAQQSANEALQSANEAQQSATEAQQSAKEAQQSATEAQQSATEAENVANEAKITAELAESKINIFRVSASLVSNGTVSADKNYAEILDAYETQKFIFARITIEGKTVETTEIWLGQNEIYFNLDFKGANYCLKCTNDNKWSYLESVPTQSGDIPTVDSSVDDTSQNPVQNKAVKEYVDDYVRIINGIHLRSGTFANAIYWNRGTIDVLDGIAVSSKVSAYTLDYYKCNESVVITTLSDVKIKLFFYSAPSSDFYLQNNQTDWLFGTVNLSEYIPQGANYFRISARFMPEGSTNGENLSGENISLVSDNVKMERYYDAAPFTTLFELDKKIDDEIGDIETAIDNIIAIQNTLIGGDE
ncbi:MAG: hypothetical protein E7407_03730 [Ruminococcaceae bacterium]|nr:hypothetical protein [Oscillospiraceae bacterium]